MLFGLAQSAPAPTLKLVKEALCAGRNTRLSVPSILSIDSLPDGMRPASEKTLISAARAGDFLHF